MKLIQSQIVIWSTVLLHFLSVSPTAAVSKTIVQRAAFGIEIGNWQPHSLNDEPRFADFGAAGATPFVGLSIVFPLKSDLGLRLSIDYWALRDLEETEHVHSLTIHPICLDLKYWLIPDYWLSAFVMYGGGVYWGVENETDPFGDRLSKARAGWGANLGTGVDLAISRHLGIGILLQYHFVRFPEPVGGVEDYSGPKVGGELHWFF
ncbi:hypothetical protein HQ585_20330 [candidate division KSB1 bacterium]|nr:hypothetical protein [candidate division KSB1 bacterium]